MYKRKEAFSKGRASFLLYACLLRHLSPFSSEKSFLRQRRNRLGGFFKTNFLHLPLKKKQI